MTANRDDRLALDYQEMLKIQDRPYLSWIVTKGEPPYAQEYLLNVNIRTYVFSAVNGVCTVGAIRHCVIRLTLRDSYPLVAPYIRMLTVPPVFHPDWYSKGSYCPSQAWRPDNSLKEYIIRMLRTLTYDPELIETASPANYKAAEWFMKNRGNPSLFPSDMTVLSENVQATDPCGAFDEIVDSWTVK